MVGVMTPRPMIKAFQSLLLLTMTAPLGAQVVVYELSGSAAGDNFGKRLSRIADIDGDGQADLLVAAPRADFAGVNSGSVYAISGASGVQIYRIDGATSGELFGEALGVLGDVNGDGFEDWLVGAPLASIGTTRNGRVDVRSGFDGTLLSQEIGSEGFGNLGTAVAGLGDVNGDSIPDYVVSGPFENANGNDAGAVYVLSGANSSFLRVHVGTNAQDRLGLSVQGCGDVDGDGVDDYAAGTFYPNGGLGTVDVWSGQSGSFIRSFAGTSQSGPIGTNMASLADLNGDGRRELAIAAIEDSSTGSTTGAVRVYNVQSGALLQSAFGQAGQSLGLAVANVGDWDGDGQEDWIVGRHDSANQGGAVIFSGSTNNALAIQSPLPHHDILGSSFAGGFDLNGDGLAEYAVGDPSANGNGNDSGSVLMVSMLNLLGTALCYGDGTGASCPCGNFGNAAEGCLNSSGNGARLEATGSVSASADDLEMHVYGAAPLKPCLLFAGTGALNGGLGSSFGDGILCASGTIQRLEVRFTDSAGAAHWGPSILSSQGWGAGLDRLFQVWFRDGSGSPCGAFFNLSNGLLLHVGL